MILIISTCQEKLSEEEFVKPVIKVIGNDYEIKHYSEELDINKYEKIIICGTALQDFTVFDHLEKFSWLKEIKKPVLGICAGMQIIGLTFRAKLIDYAEIGITKVKTIKENKLFSGEFEVYSLHKCALENLEDFEISESLNRDMAKIINKYF